MNKFDKILTDTIKNDKLETKPSDTVFNHLRNQMIVHSATVKTRQNSFLPIFSEPSGKKGKLWKISVAAVLLISFMGIKQMNHNNLYIQSADSTQMHQNLDTLSFQIVDSSLTY